VWRRSTIYSLKVCYFVPDKELQDARTKVANVQPTEEQIHQFLWFALKQHPHLNRWSVGQRN
jgi:hypothetical protein